MFVAFLSREENFRGSTHGFRHARLKVILRRVVFQQQRQILAMKRGTRQERAWADALTHSSRRTEELAVGSDPELDELVGKAELGRRVASAGQQLPEEYRCVVEMRHFREQSRAAIAAQLGKSPAAIRMDGGAP